jgi:outer membrane lipoprotein SlyB
MDAPGRLQSAADERDDVKITRREDDGEESVVVDFGRGAEVSLDIVGETAIVVADDRQIEFEVPDEATDVTANDGILTIRK